MSEKMSKHPARCNRRVRYQIFHPIAEDAALRAGGTPGGETITGTALTHFSLRSPVSRECFRALLVMSEADKNSMNGQGENRGRRTVTIAVMALVLVVVTVVVIQTIQRAPSAGGSGGQGGPPTLPPAAVYVTDIIRENTRDETMVTGTFQTAFPNGKPAADGEDAPSPLAPGLTSGQGTLVVIADADWMMDTYSVRRMNFMGVQAAEPLNDNLAFGTNLVEFLGGSKDLISIRTKGSSTHPFTVVREMEAAAQQRYQEQLEALDVERRVALVLGRPADLESEYIAVVALARDDVAHRDLGRDGEPHAACRARRPGSATRARAATSSR